MDRLDLVLGQDLDRSIRVDEAAPRELPDPARCASRAAVHSLVFAHALDATAGHLILRPVPAGASSIQATRRIDRECSEGRRNTATLKILALAVLIVVGVAAVGVSVGGLGAGGRPRPNT